MSYEFPRELAVFGSERWCEYTLEVNDKTFLLRITPDGEKMENIHAMHIGDPIIVPDPATSRTLGIQCSTMHTRYKHGFHRLRFDTSGGRKKFVTWKNRYFSNGSKWLGSFSKRITSDSYDLHRYLHWTLDTKLVPDGDGGYEEVHNDGYLN